MAEDRNLKTLEGSGGNLKSTEESANMKVPEESVDNMPGSTDGTVAAIYIDPAKESKVVRKFDMFFMPQLVIIMILSYLDRTNIGNARIFGFEEDLGLKGNEFANISSLFYVTYVVFELPWVIAVKRYGANWVLAIAIIGWSAITIGTGFCHNYHQVIACRLLLGATEAGLVPALTFLISTIYPRRSQGKRVATLYGATAISGAFGGLIAYGIQRMGARQGLEAWRWLFIVEGAISLFLGIVAFLTLPKSASSAWFLSKEENALIEQRIKRDVAYTGEDEGFSWSYVVMALTDVVVWISALSIFCAGIPLFGFGIFLPTIIRGMGFESLQVNYLTIPVYVVACIFLGAVTWLSDRVGKRAIFAALVPIVVIIGYAIVIGTASVGAGFFAMFLCSGVYTYNTLVLAWVSNNIKPDYKRSAALPIVLSIANISGVAASQVYPNYTAPRFILGNAISLSMEFVAGLGVAIIYFLLRRRNQIKAKQRAEGITDNGQIGDKSLDFEYIL